MAGQGTGRAAGVLGRKLTDSGPLKPMVALVSAALGLALYPQSASAAAVLLQAVNLTDQNMSTEGGEATLFRLTNQKPVRCKIEVVHYGETGRTTYRFIFADKLHYAARREFSYPRPIYEMRRLRMSLKRELLLASPEGTSVLPGDFQTYKAFFKSAKLRQCSGKARL